MNAWPLSTAVAALPVFTLFFVLMALKQRVWVSALAGMLVAMLLALGVFGMPAPLIGHSAVLGCGVRPAPHRLDHHRVDLPLPRGLSTRGSSR